MRLTAGVLLLACTILLPHACADTPEERAEAKETADAEAGTQGSRHVGEVSAHNGDETEPDVVHTNLHGSSQEDAIQAIEHEMEEAGFTLTAETYQLIEKVAAEYVNGSRKGAPSYRNSPLDTVPRRALQRSISKRQFTQRKNQWEKGVVPYTFLEWDDLRESVSPEGKIEIKNAMKYYEANTCIRFPPLTPTVHKEYGLHHKHFIRLVQYEPGDCSSGVGQRTYGVKCCNSYGVALHELGHALGLSHEQSRAERERYVRLHPENAKPGARNGIGAPPSKNLLYLHPYDYGSMMHYGKYYFSGNGLPTLTIADPKDDFLLGNAEHDISHYDLMGLNDFYDCNVPCPAEKKALKCENDGFVDHTCKCRCSALFMGERCEKIWRPQVVSTWPSGSYGLAATADGCPSTGTWSTGSRTHITEDSSKQQYAFLKNFTTPVVVDHFCMKSDPASGSGDWPAGTYCIYQQGDSCPTGFRSGSITLDDDNDRAAENSVNGSLPKGVFNQDTQYFFCCRNDKNYKEAITLPVGEEFQLFRFGENCQHVKDANNRGYWMGYDQMDRDPISNSTEPHPDYGTSEGKIWIYICYYMPINYECGGTIILNATNPSVNISSPNYPQKYDNNLECIWSIKAPKGKFLALDFNDFEVEENGDRKCHDTVEVRRVLVAQPGRKYCGRGLKRSIITETGFIVMVLRTDRNEPRRGFTSTVRIISDAEQCINTEDRGVSYRGAVDYTQHYQKCIPWDQAPVECSSQRPVSPFIPKYIHSGLAWNSQCRNPNNLLRPWCYVDKFCQMDFCDVCGLAKCYDFYDDCYELAIKDPKYCSTDEGFHGCHKTCKYCGWKIDKSVKSCPAPIVKDKHAAIEPAKANQTTFAFGEKVKIVCENKVDNAPVGSELTCTTDGKYEGAELMCGIVCPFGWVRLRDNCYKLVKEVVKKHEAKAACKAENAFVVDIRDEEENVFVNDLVENNDIWIGLEKWSGVWKWDNGFNQSFPYSSWKLTDRYNKYSCAAMETGALWYDTHCKWTKWFVCKKPHTEFDREYYCVDEEPNCYDILVQNPKICRQNRQYSFTQCRHSCGLCPVMDCSNTGLISNTTQIVTETYIRPGDWLDYNCSSGYELAAGNLARMCLMNGTLAGKPPICRPEDEFEDTYGHRVVPRYDDESSEKLTVYDSPKAIIKRHGKVIRWDLYSSRRTTLLAQVWRRHDKKVNNTFTLVGQTFLTLRPKRVNTYILKSFEEFYVQPGDLLGWYTPMKQGLVYSDCEAKYLDHSRIAYQTNETNMGEMVLGVKQTLPVKDTCYTYSISATVAAGHIGTFLNVAAASNGATCIDASTNKDICGLAIDGGLMPYNNAWMSANEGVGSFITIKFAGEYYLIGAKIMQRLSKTGQNLMLTLTFSDGSTQKIGLNEQQGTSTMDTKAESWNSFNLTTVKTSSVKVSVDSVYSTDYNGFIEVEMYAGCPDGWVVHQSSCYRKGPTKKSWPDAEGACQALITASHLVTISSEEENSFVKTLITGDTWIGFNDRETEGRFVWVDGSDVVYTKWDKPPNNYANQDCAEMYKGGRWDDSYCDDAQYYVCELNLDIKTKTDPVTLGNPVQPRYRIDGSGDRGYIYLVPGSKTLTVPKAGSIMAWKVYARLDSLMTMLVLRPSKANSYTLLGRNTIPTRGNLTNIIEVQSFNRITVAAGDLIGWYYLPSQKPAIPYDKCSSPDVTTVWMKHPSSAPIDVGTTITPTGDTTCTIYSISYILTEEILPKINVAAASRGSTCTDASSNKDICGLAIDGGLLPYNNAWISDNEGVGSFITIKFAGEYTLIGARIMQRLSKTGQNRKLTLTFSDASTQKITLGENKGTSALDVKAARWDAFDLTPVMTSSVKVSVDSVYSTDSNGFIEVEMYAGCPDGWIVHKTSCYKKVDTKTTWVAAEAACQSLTKVAHLASITSAEENSFVKSLLTSNTWIGFNQRTAEKKWTWTDGSSTSHTNWTKGSPENWNYREQCARMTTGGLWNNVYCSDQIQYLCEIHLDNKKQPEPVTLGNPVQPRGSTSGSGSVGYIYLVPGSETLTVPKAGSIMAWKLYAESDYEITMMVLRPGKGNNYTLVGENTVSIRGNVTNIIDIVPLDRIKVTAGDIIAWYYLPGQNPQIPYDGCSSANVRTKWIKHPTAEPLVVGDTKQTSTDDNSCRTYSISYILTEEQTQLENVAALTSLATCPDASSGQRLCHMALDEKLTDWDSTWVPDSPPTGQSLDIKLDDTYSVLGGRIMQRMSAAAQIKHIKVDFGNGKTTKVQLKKRQGSRDDDYRAQLWDAFSLNQTVDTKLVKITILELYPQINQTTDTKVGLIEVQILSTGCPAGWTRYKQNCYKENPTVQFYAESEATCQQQQAHISSIKDAEENSFLLRLSKGRALYIGYKWDGSKWAAEDGSNMTYSNWENGDRDYKCGALESNGIWKYQLCRVYYKKPVICKKPLSSNNLLPYSFVGNTAEPRNSKDGSGWVNEIAFEYSPSMTFTRSGSIRAWKLYSTSAADIKMMVVRPVKGSDTKFTIVGDNALMLPAAKTDVHTIAPFDRINVQAGDIIAWFYLRGSDPTIPYGPCKSSDVKIIWSDVPSDGPFIVGGEVSGTIKEGCRRYSISALLDHKPAPTVYNIARGASCTASTSSATCSLAVDGGMLPFDSAWVSRGEGVGAWLQFTFQGKFPIFGARIQQRLASSSRIKELEFTFSDGSTQLVKFGERNGKDQKDYGSTAWDVFPLENVNTKSVKLTVKAVYGSDEVGFIEVEMISGGCLEGWTQYQGSCYKYHDMPRSWEQANKYCISLGAHLVTILDKQENEFVRNLADSTAFSRYSWIGYNVANGNWIDVLGKPTTFTKWESGYGLPNGAPCVGTYVKDGIWFNIACSRDYNFTCERTVGVKQPEQVTLGNPVQPRGSTDGPGTIGYIYLVPGSKTLTVPKAGSIMAWKLYAESDYDITMMVLRMSEANSYTLVGENTVSLRGKVTNIIDIVPLDRIKVTAGDIIAWYYLPGQNPQIPYDTCGSANVRTKWIKHPTTEPLVVGDTKQTATNDASCHTYSISYILTEEQTQLENMAALTSLATCPDASSGQRLCHMALDEKLTDWDSTWIPDSPPTGQSLDIKLDDTYSVLGGRIMQRMSAAAQIKHIKVDFGNGKTTKVQLKKRQGSRDDDYRAQLWDAFSLNQTVDTKLVKITILELYPQINQTTDTKVGLIEVQILSTGCPAGWTRYKQNCYKENPTVQFYAESEATCQQQQAHISSIKDAEENSFLLRLSKGRALYIGYKWDGSKWAAEDGSNMTYSNWENGDRDYKCGALESNGIWKYQLCRVYYKKPVICKKPLSSNNVLPYSFVGNTAEPRKSKDGSGWVNEIAFEYSPSMTFTRSGSIRAWKLYSTSAADIKMMVVRPVTGSDTKFTIVGENALMLPAAKTDVHTIAPFDRINVQAGDIIAWFYLRGSDPTIPYGSCKSSDVKTIWSDVPSDGPFIVGGEVSGTIKEGCRRYSISALLDHKPAPTVYNIARGASCTASTSPATCSLAVDGGMLPFDSAWVSRGEGVGAWLQFTFQGKFPIFGARIQQRLASSSRIKELEFTFSDGSTQLVKFGERNGKDQKDYGSTAWDVFPLENVYTTSVKLTVKAVYGSDEVGFIEVEMISGACMEGWTQYRGSCYKYHDVVKTWEEANKYCNSIGAHLVTILDKQENEFVRNLADSTAFSRYSWIGYNVANGNWTDVLGKPTTFTKWETGYGLPKGPSCVGTYVSDGIWFNIVCSRDYNFTCERTVGVSLTPVKVVGGTAERRSSFDSPGKIIIADRKESRFTEAGRVTAWKVYSAKKSVAILSVYRPIPSKPTTFTFVGSNAVATEKERVTYLTVTKSFQIPVLPNDVIGIQSSLSNGDAGIPYATCNNEEVKMNSYELKSGWSNPNPGQNVKFNSLSTWYPCRTYSVSALVEGARETSLSNVAAALVGTTCEASVEKVYCGKVIDGDIAPTSVWTVAASPASGNWVKLTFEESFTVESISIMQRFGAEGQTKDVKLEFSSATPQTVTLKQRLYGTNTDTRNGFWDDFEIDKVDTTFVKLTITTVYTESKNGFVEIKVFAGCCPGYDRYKDSCYKLVKEGLKYFDARDRCYADGAMLVRVDDADENKYLRTLAGDEKIWIGFRDNFVAKPDAVWGWEDGKDYTYTHWAKDPVTGAAISPVEEGTSGYCAVQEKDGWWKDYKSNGYWNRFWSVCEKHAPGVNRHLKGSFVGHAAVPERRVSGSENTKYMFIERSASMTFTHPGTIREWRIYSKAAADITMMVVRPVEGSDRTFKVIGSNDFKIQTGKNKVQIATTSRIRVIPGDLIAWYYGSNPSIAFELCSASAVAILWAGPDLPGVGEEVTCTASTSDTCRKHSIGAIVDQDASTKKRDAQEAAESDSMLMRNVREDVRDRHPPQGLLPRQGRDVRAIPLPRQVV